MEDEFLFDRSPFVDLPKIDGKEICAVEWFSKIDQMPSPRIIKVWTLRKCLVKMVRTNLTADSLSVRTVTLQSVGMLQGHFCRKKCQGKTKVRSR